MITQIDRYRELARSCSSVTTVSHSSMTIVFCNSCQENGTRGMWRQSFKLTKRQNPTYRWRHIIVTRFRWNRLRLKTRIINLPKEYRMTEIRSYTRKTRSHSILDKIIKKKNQVSENRSSIKSFVRQKAECHPLKCLRPSYTRQQIRCVDTWDCCLDIENC